MSLGPWLIAFGITQAVEVPIYAVVLSPIGVGRRLLIGFGASALTHPWVWFILPNAVQPYLGYWGYAVVAEGLAWGAETVYLLTTGLPGKHAALASLAANGCSVLVGFAWHAWR